MAGPPTPSQALTLSEVADLLQVSPRWVQYLRERGLVSPHGARGRGNRVLYSGENVRDLKFLLALNGLNELALRTALQEVRWDKDTFEIALSRQATLRVDLRSIR